MLAGFFLMRASWRRNNRLARAVIALCTPSVSQMAYPTEEEKKRSMTRAAVRFSFPSPSGRRAWRRLQCCIHRRRSRTLKYYRIPINSSAVAPVPTLGGLDAGCLWLAVPSTSRNARLLPLSSRKLSRLEPKWPARAEWPASVLWLGTEPKWRAARGSDWGAVSLISSSGRIHSLARAGVDHQSLHHLTSAFPRRISIIFNI